MQSFDLFVFDKWNVTTPNVATPTSILGFGGWESLGYVFTDGKDLIYAVEPATGNLLRYRNALGTVQVSGPDVIGRGGWNSLTLLSANGAGLIFAVDPSSGNLLRYSGADVAGDGQVANPIVIGRGGWNAFSFLFAGEGGLLYAVEPNSGNLLRYRNADTAGDGEVASPETIGWGGWSDFVFLFAGPDDKILGIKSNSSLYGYDGASAALSAPVWISDGWTRLLQVFASGYRLFAIAPGPSRIEQVLKTTTIDFESVLDKKEFDDNVHQWILYGHVDQGVDVPGVVNSVSVTRLEWTGQSLLDAWLVLRWGDIATPLSEGLATIMFRGAIGSDGQRTMLHLYASNVRYLDYSSGATGLIFVNGGVRGSLKVSYWADP